MLTTVPVVKARLGLDPLDPTLDALLTRAIAMVSARFDLETHRTLARTENAMFEFSGDDTELVVPCYPIESILKFELKSAEAEGWIEQTGVEYVIRRRCVISLESTLSLGAAGNFSPVARVTYTGGYVMTGDSETAAAHPEAELLPFELEQAAVEQTAFWFQTKDQLGVVRQWPKGGNYEQLADPDLLPSVREVLGRYTRYRV